MSTLVQDLIVSLVALGAFSAIGLRARAMFASKRSGAACPSCTKCPATASALPAASLTAPQDPQSRVIRLTVVQ
jgi:hypothetical protein